MSVPAGRGLISFAGFASTGVDFAIPVESNGILQFGRERMDWIFSAPLQPVNEKLLP